MSPREIIFAPKAEKEIKKLQKPDQKKVMKALQLFRSGDARQNIEKIKTHPDYYRISASNMRIIYHSLTKERVVILLIRDRKDAYRGLNALDQRLETALTVIEDHAKASLGMC